MHATPDYEDVARELALGASTVHPSEAHGCLCGALCAGRDYSVDEWLAEILPDDGATAGDGALARLHQQSAAALAGPDLEFQPLLPDDEVALGVRVEALAAWCAGFLYGFGAAGQADSQRGLTPDVTEVLADLARIAQAGAPGPEPLEEDEDAYAELIEFLRAAVQVVYEELDAPRAATRRSRPAR